MTPKQEEPASPRELQLEAILQKAKRLVDDCGNIIWWRETSLLKETLAESGAVSPQKLRECHVCGKKSFTFNRFGNWGVRCEEKECPVGPSILGFFTEEGAITAWNNRPIEDALRAEVATLNAMLNLQNEAYVESGDLLKNLRAENVQLRKVLRETMRIFTSGDQNIPITESMQVLDEVRELLTKD